jgi:hypothetical protein
MVTTHREVVARLGASPRAVLLDSPYGFQENAGDISRRATEYFAQRVQLHIEVARFPGPLAVHPEDRSPQPEPGELGRVRAAAYVFAGPGSPSYALAVWHRSSMAEALVDKVAQGGAVVFASAAAITLGRHSLPVYEIYKAGQPVHWLPGLDLVGALGLPRDCAVIPHYDNTEGGTHDTRFCYMGERRLEELEALLPPSGWILGVDEHTSLVLDAGTGQALVTGRGGVTVRRRGRSLRYEAGARLALEALAEAARSGDETATAGDARGAVSGPVESEGGATPAPSARSPLLQGVADLERAFDAAVADRQADRAVAAILALDRLILEWAADTLQTDEPDRARAVLHALVHRLGQAAGIGLRDPHEPLRPLMEGLIALRADLRGERAFAVADRLRDRLVEAGIELRDTPEGTAWALRPRDPGQTSR